MHHMPRTAECTNLSTVTLLLSSYSQNFKPLTIFCGCTACLCLTCLETQRQVFLHIERSSGAIKTACDIQIDRKRGPGRPKISWQTLTETIVSGISKSVRSAMRAACQLPRREPIDANDAPAPAR